MPDLTPVKLNAVVVRGYNDTDVVDLARLTLEHPWQVRYIEMMPFAGATELQPTQVVSAGRNDERIQDASGPLEVANDGKLDGEARIYPAAGRSRRAGLYLLGLAALLRHLHPRAPDRRRAHAPVPAA